MDLWKIKVVHLKHKEVPMLMIRVTINRKVCYVKTPFIVTEKQLKDERVISHPNMNKINLSLRKQKAKIEDHLMNLNLAGTEITTGLLKNILKGKTNSKYLADYVKTLINPRNRIGYTKELNRIKKYDPFISLTDIDSDFIRRYEEHERKRGMSQNTLNTSFKWLRRVLNQGVEDGYIKTNPVRKVPKYVQSERIYLIKEEREKIYQFWKGGNVEGSLYITLTYFLLGMFSGLRHSDWGTVVKKISGNFIKLQAQKNKESVVIPIGPTLGEILEVVKTLPPPFSGDKTREHLKIVSGQMKMKKNITTHTARHSFGAMCAELKLPKSVTAELMAITVDTVDTYYHLSGANIIEQAAVLKEV